MSVRTAGEHGTISKLLPAATTPVGAVLDSGALVARAVAVAGRALSPATRRTYKAVYSAPP